MTIPSADALFPRGLLRQELYVGVASSVAARTVGINLSEAGRPSGSHFDGGRYGRGEVGEFVLIEGQQSLLLGRIAEIRVRESERRTLGRDFSGATDFDAMGQVQLLGCVGMDDLRVTAGVDAYPRLGDRVYAAPHEFIALLPQLMRGAAHVDSVRLHLGGVGGANESKVVIEPERLFGRHCAILGATGGGKSWTTARVLDEALRFRSKLVLIDATGEYAPFQGAHVEHYHLGNPLAPAPTSSGCGLPPTSFTESDFIALFEPAGKVQGPKLRAAIRSLRLAKMRPDLAPKGFIEKINQSKSQVEAAEQTPDVSRRLDDPVEPFDPRILVRQMEQECVYPEGFKQGGHRGERDPTMWGGEDGNFSHCLSLVARINGVLSSSSFSSVFAEHGNPSLTDRIRAFSLSDARLLRIDLSGVGYEFQAREIIANVIGRHFLLEARAGRYAQSPTVVFVDEAHNFLGRRVGLEEKLSRPQLKVVAPGIP
ncbi:MAG: DUF87 domain-containing protein [Dehalococcoidia bacterium]